MLRTMREFLQWRQGDSIILAEANVLPETDMEYFGSDGDRMQMMFNFQVNQHLFYALAAADHRPLQTALKKNAVTSSHGSVGACSSAIMMSSIWGVSTKEQRQDVFDAFGPEPRMQLYDRGIRRRLAPMLDGDQRRLRLAYSLMFTLPGTPVMRYGDELGMGDDLDPRAWLRPHADAVVDRTARRLHQERQADRSCHQRRALRLRARERGRAAARPRLDCSTGSSASCGCARKCPRSAGATSPS